MLGRRSLGAVAIMAALCAADVTASAFDDARYPDWKGQWTRARVPGATGQPPVTRNLKAPPSTAAHS
jgi:hypothetical protein